MVALIAVIPSCSPQKAEKVQPVKIADNDYEPANWGKAYPVNYELWKKTEEPTPAGKSKYKRGFDADRITYDKLSEFPYMALLFNGWGFGVEYNEPQGHAYMVTRSTSRASRRAASACPARPPTLPRWKKRWARTITGSPTPRSMP
jgi:nitrite reductase (cytochrome c-552)